MGGWACFQGRVIGTHTQVYVKQMEPDSVLSGNDDPPTLQLLNIYLPRY